MLGLASLAVTPVWLGIGCAAGNQETSTTATGSSHSSSTGSGGGTGGHAGHGGTGGHAGHGGTGGHAGHGGTGGSACVPEPEVCDGKDNNCDGQIDEGCPCKLGDTQPCYSGPASTVGVGACKEGVSTCDIHGVWGSCVGEVIPSMEVCDLVDNDCNGSIDEGLGFTTCGVGACKTTQDNCVDGHLVQCTPGLPVPEKCNGIDDSCDGIIDEGCVCQDGQTQPCYSGATNTKNVGACHDGIQNCVNGAWAACTGDVTPQPETCNAIDDDCNGVVDDGLGSSTCGVGACKAIAQNCVGGQVQTCTPGDPTAEVCDGIDNDCNGQVDDGLGTVSCGLGACANTVPACKNGVPNTCNALPAQVETCNGVDDNCNGVIDDGNPGGGAACTTALPGVCAAGTVNCLGGSLQCTQLSQPSAEICDGKDNDCNGQVDDGNPGGGIVCNSGKQGVCSPGTTACTGGAIVCNQNVQPSAEVCDGLDNNCNGQVDEGNPGGGLACDTTKQGVCAAGTTACTGGSIVCNQNVQPSAEVCDGLDNNCNGQADEGNPGGGLSCTTSKPGICSAGTTACTGGSIVCNQNLQPKTEVCNGLDDNCDGTVDEGNPGGGVPSNTGKLGVCAAGTTACQGGQIVCVQTVQASAEVCDGLDNNCDGQVDEGVKTTFYRDADGDGYGDGAQTAQACSAPSGYVAVAGDCNDGNAAVHPGATETCNGVDDNCDGQIDEGVKTTYYRDADSDGYGNPALSTQACAQPAGYVTDSSDCNDGNAAVHPGATETCNGVDDNCDGQIDEGVKTTFYADADSDGYGNPSVTVQACTKPSGYVVNNTDCNDSNAAVHPGATEICNGADDNCDGQVDEGNPGGAQACGTGLLGVCSAGTTACQGGALRCNQNVQPSAEVCDGLDNNCDGQTDEGVKTTYYRDADSDGYGNPALSTQACAQPAGYVTNNADCNDGNAAVRPGATELCNGVDDNCDGQIDEGVKTTYYADSDSDGYGNPASSVQACSKPAGYVANNTDCNDSNAGVHPGATELCNGVDDNCDGQIDEGNPGGGQACATGQLGVCAAGTTACTSGALVCNRNTAPSAEVCDGLDNDCNGQVDDGVKTTYYRDADSDGYGDPSTSVQACTKPAGYVADKTDCNDGNAAVHPGATELCNGVDDNCNGTIDEGVKTTYYADADGDGYGNPSAAVQACSQPAGYVTNATDCNDTSNSIHPGAAELCNGVDDNCNGTIDELNPGGGVACGACNQGTTLCSAGSITCANANQGLATYYRDADGDGYGNPLVTTQACSLPTGYVTTATDCNDNNGAIHPGATELCNGADDNCNGQIDEGNPGGGLACSTGKSGVCAAGTTVCTGGAVACSQNTASSAETCDGLDNDCDGNVDNALFTDGMPNSCASAANKTVSVSLPGSSTVSGYVDMNGDDWFVVNFTGVGGAGAYYHPKISFSSNPGTQFKLQVFSACGTPAVPSCSGGNLDTFEMSYPLNVLACVTNANCTDNTTRVTQLIVHVLRAAGTNATTNTCTPYTVLVADQ
jgi:hypothetical protein